MINNDSNIELEEFKYLIDSRNLTDEEKEKEREAILKAREERFRKRSHSESVVAKLVQLKYHMEEYLKESECKSSPVFQTFLSRYVDTLYQKRKDFAADISIQPITLSHIINNHREPNNTFFQRLIIHSQNTYKPIGNFEKELWLKVFFQDKVCSLSSSSGTWIESEQKYVKIRLFEI